MTMRRIDRTDVNVFPLCLGGNVFGWTVNERDAFALLDRYAAAGGNFVDTADVYSAWVPGHTGGESETIIGRWMASRQTRRRMVIATKVGMAPGLKGLAPTTIRTAAEASLERLGVEYLDLYIGASNYTAPRLAEALAASDREGLARYVALQPHYNLLHRREYEGDLRDLCAREGLACLPYYALAKGFLTGKYRPGVHVDSVRSAAAGAYLDAHGLQVLSVLDEIAATRHTTVAAVSLAWLLAQSTVAAPIASARTVEQLADLLPGATLTLTEAEVARLSAG
jgi:aryl-alcohol dehydrogenase-like predicted oxidoreductase